MAGSAGISGASGNSTIREQRLRIRLHLADNPSLKTWLDDAYARAYELAVIAAARETGLAEAAFPIAPPFGAAEAMDANFWPD